MLRPRGAVSHREHPARYSVEGPPNDSGAFYFDSEWLFILARDCKCPIGEPRSWFKIVKVGQWGAQCSRADVAGNMSAGIARCHEIAYAGSLIEMIDKLDVSIVGSDRRVLRDRRGPCSIHG